MKRQILLALTILFTILNASSSFARDPHEVLGVANTADQATIKSAFRRLAMKYHPDRNPGDPDAQAKFVEVRLAYEALTKDPSSNADFTRRSEQTRDEQSDELGAKYSNPRWPYDATTHRFYDNRTGLWIGRSRLGGWMTDSGWVFSPSSGNYNYVDAGAEWNPDNSKGWHRNISNFSDEFIRVDIRTGFSLASNYQPRTASAYSHLFDQVLNPINLLQARSGKFDRQALLTELNSLRWTPELIADYRERVREHIRIFARQDMQPKFTTQVYYSETMMEAILDNEITRSNPELVSEFIRALPPGHSERLVRNHLLADSYMNHSNARVWISEMARNENLTNFFIEWLFPHGGTIEEALMKFEKFYALTVDTPLRSSSIEKLIRSLGWSHGPAGYKAFQVFLAQIVPSQAFTEMIANADPKFSDPLVDFLRWYTTVDPRNSDVYRKALAMPGAVRDDYWRVTPDLTRNVFHEQEFNVARQTFGTARRRYIQEHLVSTPSRALSPVVPRTAVRTCEGLFK